jgi:DNA modification methylase
VDLVYLDPPFFSNRHYEVIWGDEAEVRSFEDRWEGGIQVYIDWMRKRTMEIQRVLRPTGTVYLHCDPHASHHLRVMLDGVFGPSQFQSEVIWHYRGGGVSPRRWGRRHDTLFAYTKGKEWTFNVDPVREAYSEESLERLKYKARAFRGDRTYDNYEPNPLGKHPDDVWDMQPIMPSAKERLGYPTQKPERLLERIILAASNEGDVVLDPFCGCGTTVAVAERLKRQWVGIDISPTAVNLMEKRVIAQSHGACRPKLIGMPKTIDELRALKPFEFQNWVIQRCHGNHAPRKSGDMGIDGYSFMAQDPIQVKQSEAVGRNVIDNFETAMRRAQKAHGYVVAFSFTKNAREEIARARWEDQLDIELVTVAQLLNPPVRRPFSLIPSPAELLDFPLPAARAKGALPSSDELVSSARQVS